MLRAWGTAEFEAVFKFEVSQLPHHDFPLQQALVMGSDVVTAPFTPMLLSAIDAGSTLDITAGVFFQSVMAGCSCADDPTSSSENSEYCEIRFQIDKITGTTTVTLL